MVEMRLERGAAPSRSHWDEAVGEQEAQEAPSPFPESVPAFRSTTGFRPLFFATLPGHPPVTLPVLPLASPAPPPPPSSPPSSPPLPPTPLPSLLFIGEASVAATVRLQAAWRRSCAKRAVVRLQTAHTAAVKLQNARRMSVSRRVLWNLRNPDSRTKLSGGSGWACTVTQAQGQAASLLIDSMVDTDPTVRDTAFRLVATYRRSGKIDVSHYSGPAITTYCRVHTTLCLTTHHPLTAHHSPLATCHHS